MTEGGKSICFGDPPRFPILHATPAYWSLDESCWHGRRLHWHAWGVPGSRGWLPTPEGFLIEYVPDCNLNHNLQLFGDTREVLYSCINVLVNSDICYGNWLPNSSDIPRPWQRQSLWWPVGSGVNGFFGLMVLVCVFCILSSRLWRHYNRKYQYQEIASQGMNIQHLEVGYTYDCQDCCSFLTNCSFLTHADTGPFCWHKRLTPLFFSITRIALGPFRRKTK